MKDQQLTIVSPEIEDTLLDTILQFPPYEKEVVELNLKPRISRAEYISQINRIMQHIQHGDIYEINFCLEFSQTGTIDPYAYYLAMKELLPSPFSAFFRYVHRAL